MDNNNSNQNFSKTDVLKSSGFLPIQRPIKALSQDKNSNLIKSSNIDLNQPIYEAQHEDESYDNDSWIDSVLVSCKNPNLPTVIKQLKDDPDLEYILKDHKQLIMAFRDIQSLSAEQMIGIITAAESETIMQSQKESESFDDPFEGKSYNLLEKSKKIENDNLELVKKEKEELKIKEDLQKKIESYEKEMSQLNELKAKYDIIERENKEIRFKLDDQNKKDQYIQELKDELNKEKGLYSTLNEKNLKLESLLKQSNEISDQHNLNKINRNEFISDKFQLKEESKFNSFSLKNSKSPEVHRLIDNSLNSLKMGNFSPIGKLSQNDVLNKNQKLSPINSPLLIPAPTTSFGKEKMKLINEEDKFGQYEKESENDLIKIIEELRKENKMLSQQLISMNEPFKSEMGEERLNINPNEHRSSIGKENLNLNLNLIENLKRNEIPQREEGELFSSFKSKLNEMGKRINDLSDTIKKINSNQLFPILPNKIDSLSNEFKKLSEEFAKLRTVPYQPEFFQIKNSEKYSSHKLKMHKMRNEIDVLMQENDTLKKENLFLGQSKLHSEIMHSQTDVNHKLRRDYEEALNKQHQLISEICELKQQNINLQQEYFNDLRKVQMGFLKNADELKQGMRGELIDYKIKIDEMIILQKTQMKNEGFHSSYPFREPIYIKQIGHDDRISFLERNLTDLELKNKILENKLREYKRAHNDNIHLSKRNLKYRQEIEKLNNELNTYRTEVRVQSNSFRDKK